MTKRFYTDDQKLAALARLEKGEIAGERPLDIADELGIPQSTMLTWKYTFKKTGEFRRTNPGKRADPKGEGRRRYYPHGKGLGPRIAYMHVKAKVDRGWSITRACNKFKLSKASFTRYRDSNVNVEVPPKPEPTAKRVAAPAQQQLPIFGSPGERAITPAKVDVRTARPVNHAGGQSMELELRSGKKSLTVRAGSQDAMKIIRGFLGEDPQ